jgi:hypothetical protein
VKYKDVLELHTMLLMTIQAFVGTTPRRVVNLTTKMQDLSASILRVKVTLPCVLEIKVEERKRVQN